MLMNWKFWNARPDALADFLDMTLPNNGLNDEWVRYAMAGFVFNYKIEFVIDGVTFDKNYTSTIQNYDAPEDVTSSVKYFNLEGDEIPSILADRDCIIQFDHVLSSGDWGAEDTWGWIAYRPKNAEKRKLIHTEWDWSSVNSPLKPLAGETRAVVTFPTTNTARVRCLIAGTQVANEFTLVGRIQSPTVEPASCSIECGVNFEGYGFLYNWYSIGASKGRAVGGLVNTDMSIGNTWEVMSSADFIQLGGDLGGMSVAGRKMKTTSTMPLDTNCGLWLNSDHVGTNESNFSAVPASGRNLNGSFATPNEYALFWIPEQINSTDARSYALFYNSSELVFRSPFKKRIGLSIRMVRPVQGTESSLADFTVNGTIGVEPEPYVGNDNRIYFVVKIGGFVYLAQNLYETKYNDGELITVVTDNSTWQSTTDGARCEYLLGDLPEENGQIALYRGSYLEE
jgi:uncharacterized protein (TIGR02145 family)